MFNNDRTRNFKNNSILVSIKKQMPYFISIYEYINIKFNKNYILIQGVGYNDKKNT